MGKISVFSPRPDLRGRLDVERGGVYILLGEDNPCRGLQADAVGFASTDAVAVLAGTVVASFVASADYPPVFVLDKEQSDHVRTPGVGSRGE